MKPAYFILDHDKLIGFYHPETAELLTKKESLRYFKCKHEDCYEEITLKELLKEKK